MRRSAVLAVCATLALLLALPAVASASSISSLSLSPDSVRGGASSQGTAVVPAGATSVTFPIATNATAPPEIVQIMAAIDNVPRTANLSVNAATPAGPSLASVSVTPTRLTGGSAATGTVTFTGVTDGAEVRLASNNPAVQVPATTVVNGGKASGAFAVATSSIAANTTATITATWFGITRTTTITVTPGAPAAPDRVAIQKARWKSGLLTIEATSTNPNAILSVFSRSGSFMFTLTNKGGGRFSDQRGFHRQPAVRDRPQQPRRLRERDPEQLSGSSGVERQLRQVKK
jgi:hypothetical protein